MNSGAGCKRRLDSLLPTDNVDKNGCSIPKQGESAKLKRNERWAAFWRIVFGPHSSLRWLEINT